MNNYEVRKYKRVHNYSNPLDEEKSKIKKETQTSLKYTKKIDKEVKKYLVGNIEDDDFLDKTDEFGIIAKKETNNARTHKKRLKNIQKEDKDFM